LRSVVNIRWYALALIVIVDDEPLNLKMMRDALAKAGPFTSENLLAKVGSAWRLTSAQPQVTKVSLDGTHVRQHLGVVTRRIGLLLARDWPERRKAILSCPRVRGAFALTDGAVCIDDCALPLLPRVAERTSFLHFLSSNSWSRT